uniref:Adenylyl-sulfate kinase n=1 Tax=Hemiselmis tepida TaxID=464990 RepID=A0A7S0VBE3_9CRYP|mmetsp:Transcript_13821/g.35297  ORF Transcript_13821/g.35297 Transcript_13821/m.35297 type:complete len:264 (+) Transcript_13821:154-945(+)
MFARRAASLVATSFRRLPPAAASPASPSFGQVAAALASRRAVFPREVTSPRASSTSKPKSENIVWSDSLLSTQERLEMTGCKGATLWLTGLSGSGKSTVSSVLEKKLIERGVLAYRLDGDNVRMGLNKDMGFSKADRVENIRRIAEVSKLFTDCGIVTLTSFISPYREDRDRAREIFESDGLLFMEVHVDVPLDVAESRDPKGLYKKARSGALKNFTGIDDPYEAPLKPELVLKTHDFSVDECADQALEALRKCGVSIPEHPV